ncbi:MAG: UDP-N-acetylmuramoyl-tripeptide--D-alanyl-D-alanine ligase [Pseudomonadota bacterium]
MSNALWTSAEIAAATGGQASADFEVTGLSIDTRSLKDGELFVALKDARDGHDFAGNAFAAGASGALVSRPVEGDPTIIVEDVLPGLEQLGVAARERAADCYRVAVTGSVGKTSFKEMVARMFRALGPAHWNEKSFNNQWGVPLTLARMPRETERAVFEIGMSTPGEIAPRSLMVAPHTSVITKIAAVHLEGLGSIEAIAHEKADIFTGLLKGGYAIIPFDDDFAPLLSDLAKQHQPDFKLLTFGMGRGPDAGVLDVYSNGKTTQAIISVHGREVSISLNAVGAHWAVNAAAALLSVCPDSDEHLGAAANALDGYTPPDGRGQVETLALPGGGTFTLVDDSYNANPTSMAAALRALAARPGRRKLVALGAMGELGPTSKVLHAGMLDDVLASNAEQVWMSGEDMKALAECLPATLSAEWSERAANLVDAAKNTLKDGDTLLIKGSNASGMVQFAEALRQWSARTDGQVMDDGAERAARVDDAV